MHDAVELEKRGVVTVTLTTDEFEALAKAQARALGYPDLRLLLIPHPLGGIPMEDALAKLDVVMEELVTIIESAPDSVEAKPTEAPDSPIIEISDDWEEQQSFWESKDWSDGFPIVAPTEERVEAMLRGVERSADEVVATVAPSNSKATVRSIAVNAVMAGCRPGVVPALIAAVEAVAEEPFNLNAVQSTTHPVSVLMIFNGPIVEQLGLNAGYNVFGQGFRANATLGRAMRLILQNVGGGVPGTGDRSTMGTPAKFSFCVAENEASSPWESLAIEKGFGPNDSTVTVMGGEGPHNIGEHGSVTGEGLLITTAGSMSEFGANNFYTGGGNPLIVFGPEHAEQIARDGFTKESIKRFVWEHSRIPIERFSKEWQERIDLLMTTNPEWGPYLYVAESPAEINIIVAGGAGKHSAWLPTFGNGTRTVTRRIG